MLLRVAAAALAVAATPAPAQVQQAAPAQADEALVRRAKALELAQLVEPREKLVNPQTQAAQFEQAMLENADGRELESNYPGVIAAMWAAAAPEVEKQTEAELPAFWAKLADLYASRMTVAEIVAASSFFGSATGRKLIRLMNEGLASQASTAASSIQDGTFTPADHERLKAAAAASLAGGFSSSEEAAVEEFTQSSAGRKMLSLKEQVNALTSEWLNTANPKGEARIDALIQKAVDDFIASRKPRKGKGAR